MRVQRVQSNNTTFGVKGGFAETSLRSEILKLRKPTKEKVRQMYGTFGLALYEGKEPLTIITDEERKKSKSIVSRIVSWFTGKSLQDYKEGDSLRRVVHKYIYNKESGLVKDVETMFGEKGRENLDSLGLQGYVSL